MNLSASPELTVVIVAYGPPDALARCLDSIGPDYRVVVVDNGTSEAARHVVEGSGGHYIDPGRNLGFAAGVNLAVSERPDPSGDVLLVNPDAEVSPSSIESLRDALRSDPTLACVAPCLFDGAGQHPVQGTWPLPTPGRIWLDALALGRLVKQREFLIGAVMLLSGRALQEVGPFDERFFLYAEETDWQRRALELGWRVEVIEQAEARHVGRGTGGDPRWREAAFQASIERYIQKWFGRWGWASFRAGGSVAAARRMVRRDAKGRQAARNRLALYLKDPERVALSLGVPLPPRPEG